MTCLGFKIAIIKWFESYLSNRKFFVWGHPLSTLVKFSEKLTFLAPWDAHVRVRIRRLEMLVFRKILCTYLKDGSFLWMMFSQKLDNCGAFCLCWRFNCFWYILMISLNYSQKVSLIFMLMIRVFSTKAKTSTKMNMF